MRLRDEIRRRLARASLEPTRAAEILEELTQDLEERLADLRAGGVPPAEAEARVLAELDGLAAELTRVERSAREPVVAGAPRRGLLGDLWHDLRYAARALAKSPGFTAVTLLSLALGIGANTAIFQVIDAVQLRPLPVAEPHRLAKVEIKDREWASGGFSSWHSDLTNPMWEHIRERQQGFQSLFAWGDANFNLAPTGEARRVRGLFVSGGFFETLRVPPLLGRVLTPADDRRGCGAPGAVVSHAFWRRELGGDPGAVGRMLALNGHDVEILGVAAAGFTGPEVGRAFDVAVPICMEPLFHERSWLDNRQSYWLSVIGRLEPGWSVARAAAQLESVSAGIFEQTVPDKYPPDSVAKYKAYRLTAAPAATGISQARGAWRRPLWFLLATAGLVLLIACANLANLLLARGSARERELAVRLALGASRGRLVRQLMTESLLLAVVGAAAGLWLAGALSELMIAALDTHDRTLFMDLSLDWRVLGFAAGLAILTCLLFGLAPAWRAARTEVGLVLKATGPGAGVARFGLRRVLVAVQVAMTFVLLVGALLFARSLQKLASVEPGFDDRGVMMVSVGLAQAKLPVDRRAAAQADILERVRAVPGVVAAASTRKAPVTDNFWDQDLTIDGKAWIDTWFNRVSPGYFATLSTPLVAGRDFGAQDDLGAPVVGIINETLARKMFAGASPIGARVRAGDAEGGPTWTIDIIGVVKDSKYFALREESLPLMYVAEAQEKQPYPGIEILVRGRGPDIAAGVKSAIAEAAPQATIDVDHLERIVRDSLLGERVMALLSGLFGLLAGILATIGLYGVVAYGVARRTHEIGIRMALGADRRSITRMILRETAGLYLVGLGAGALLALGAGRAAASMLYGLAPHDPLTFALAAALLGAVCVVAAALPARRAARVDPMVALREE